MKKSLYAIGAGLGLVMLAHAMPPFERYRVILDRAPFGLAATPTQAVTYVNNLRLSALVNLPDGPRAGFVDAQGKNDFFLRLNERSDNNVELLAVDYAKERVTIRHEGQLLLLGLQPGDVTVVQAARAQGGSGAVEFHPGPLPSNLAPDVRAILSPVQPPNVNANTPESYRFHSQLQQLLNPSPPPDAANIALPMPGGLAQPQIQPAEPEQPESAAAPTLSRRGNRRGGFGG